jgi:hypothetical protein
MADPVFVEEWNQRFAQHFLTLEKDDMHGLK